MKVSCKMPDLAGKKQEPWIQDVPEEQGKKMIKLGPWTEVKAVSSK